MNVEKFGRVGDGREASLFTLSGEGGMEVSITNYGGIITGLTVPDRDGKPGNVVLGFDNLDAYLDCDAYLGALIGRYGNRISGGSFELDGKRYELSKNDGNNHLHGGERGFDKVLWDARIIDEQSLGLSYLSPHGEEGYPGNLRVRVTYSVDGMSLGIRFEAESDRPTPVNFTAHSYFNLTGSPAQTVLDHFLSIPAGKYTPENEELIPTGEIARVDGTPFDFREPARIGARIDQVAGGYDHNFILQEAAIRLRPAAVLKDPDSGRVLEVHTTAPAIQFYSGNFLDGRYSGVDGIPFEKYSGLCLEPQHYPDAPNQPAFPSAILRPGTRYKTEIRYTFPAESTGTE